MLAVWGQFLDHDITATAASQGVNGEPIECCLVDSGNLHPECFPVPIDNEDPFFQQYNVTCMNFVRSAPAPTGHFGHREQLNQATAFIDGSVVYGSSDEKQMALRTMEGGKLRMLMQNNNRTLLPVSKDPNDGCNEDAENAKGRYCFDSGDARANENLHLTSMHLIWARHHNYIADNLARLNPHWDDERLFQESRKILGAQMQHITYNEFLSVVLGKQSSEKFGIISQPSSSKDTYNASVDPSIANHFAAAAFRFAHTLLPVSPNLIIYSSLVHQFKSSSAFSSSPKIQPLRKLSQCIVCCSTLILSTTKMGSTMLWIVQWIHRSRRQIPISMTN